MWRKIRQMRKQRRRPERPLLVNGQLTKTSQEKADALANTFTKASQSNHLPPEMKEKRRNAESTFSTPPQDSSSSFNSDLTLDELSTAVTSLGTDNKATGADPISYHMIRRFPEPALRMLHTFFQTCWTTGNIPKDWKKATVVAIPQNGKPSQQTSSYRPIALTPHLGKVYERVLQNRLDHHIGNNDILPLCQAGFRKERNYMEHVVRLIEDNKKWSLKGKIKKTIATFFDIKKAFDSVWHAKLLNKIGALGITGRMYNFIQTFLDSLEITVKVGPSVSRSHILDMGVPQGSVIAPTLFSIMLHDIMTTLRPQYKPLTISLFADDLAIWSHISDYSKTNQMLAPTRCMTYGHEAYFNAPKGQWQRLASTELIALKHALVKDNEEVGCALVIPDLGITKKYHLNNGIGIYTAELYAILKACETINDMPQPPRAALVLTDSKSSLQGLASGKTKNRQEFQAEISFLTQQILYKGTDLTFMWLPPHTGIKGNELADKAAKRATEDCTHVTLQLSTSEMKNKIRQAAHSIRNDTLKTCCTEHGWVFIPMPKTSPRLTLPRKNQKLLKRIRTGHHRSSTFQNITCQCGKEATPQHIFSNCPSLAGTTTKLKDYKQKHSLGTQDFLLLHLTLGTQPIRILIDTILNSETDKWF
ncbi:hypothetical protein ACOMHN_057628 [Nucella lapillus]